MFLVRLPGLGRTAMVMMLVVGVTPHVLATHYRSLRRTGTITWSATLSLPAQKISVAILPARLTPVWSPHILLRLARRIHVGVHV